jgi:hypothetical protein
MTADSPIRQLNRWVPEGIAFDGSLAEVGDGGLVRDAVGGRGDGSAPDCRTGTRRRCFGGIGLA